MGSREIVLAAGLVAVVLGVIAFRSWADRRRFGPSRLVPAGPDPRPGETLTATLEAARHLAGAREVRLDLVELQSSGLGGRHRRRVRTTATVSFAAFQVVDGLTRIPVSLAVPADAEASMKQKKLGFSLFAEFFIGMREVEHAWEVRATAEVDGAPYRGAFRVTVAPSTPIEPEGPYTPRAIVIPPSDKRPPSTSA